jgi:hypothetical protein
MNRNYALEDLIKDSLKFRERVYTLALRVCEVFDLLRERFREEFVEVIG